MWLLLGLVGFSYPMARRERAAASQVLTPVVQLGWTDGGQARIPERRSTRVEFDQGNIPVHCRGFFRRPDRREYVAPTAAVAVNWSRFGPQWLELCGCGQVFRSVIAFPEFTEYIRSVLARAQDVFAGRQIRTTRGFSLTARNAGGCRTSTFKRQSCAGAGTLVKPPSKGPNVLARS